jgi:hypothetical protein
VRLVHLPTGLAVKCTEHRTQQQNRVTALERLRAKLLVVLEEQQAAALADIRGEVVKAEWGQQIRNYVFHPYKLVKDTRTGVVGGSWAQGVSLLSHLQHRAAVGVSRGRQAGARRPLRRACASNSRRARDQQHLSSHGRRAGRVHHRVPAAPGEEAAGGAPVRRHMTMQLSAASDAVKLACVCPV